MTTKAKRKPARKVYVVTEHARKLAAGQRAEWFAQRAEA